MFEDLIDQAHQTLTEIRTRTITDKTGKEIEVVSKTEMQRLTKDFLKKNGFQTMRVAGRQGASTSVSGVEVDADLFGNAEYISHIYATKTSGGLEARGSERVVFPSTGRSHSAPPAPGGIYTLEDYNYYAKTFLPKAQKLMTKLKKAR